MHQYGSRIVKLHHALPYLRKSPSRKGVFCTLSVCRLSKQCAYVQPSAVTSIYIVPLAFSRAITFFSAFNYLLSRPSNSHTHLTICQQADEPFSRRRTYCPPVLLKPCQCLRTKGW